MLRLSRWRDIVPQDRMALARLGCQLTSFFALQGIVILTYYAVTGSPYDLERLPPGLQLDPIHAVVHLVIGLVGGYVGFFRPFAALPFLQAFGGVYLLLAVLGTFTEFHLGMHLAFNENFLHWTVGVIAVVVGFGLIPESLFGRAEP